MSQPSETGTNPRGSMSGLQKAGRKKLKSRKTKKVMRAAKNH